MQKLKAAHAQQELSGLLSAAESHDSAAGVPDPRHEQLLPAPTTAIHSLHMHSLQRVLVVSGLM